MLFHWFQVILIPEGDRSQKCTFSDHFQKMKDFRFYSYLLIWQTKLLAYKERCNTAFQSRGPINWRNAFCYLLSLSKSSQMLSLSCSHSLFMCKDLLDWLNSLNSYKAIVLRTWGAFDNVSCIKYSPAKALGCSGCSFNILFQTCSGLYFYFSFWLWIIKRRKNRSIP